MLDMSGLDQVAYDRVLPHTYQVADRFMWSGWPTGALIWCAGGYIKRIKRAAFGIRNFANYRIRALLYAGKRRWELLSTIIPPEFWVNSNGRRNVSRVRSYDGSKEGSSG